MSSEVSKFKLGLFVTGGAIIAVVGITVLGAGRYFQKTHRVITYFDESVQGLEQGAPVKYRGVPIGRVSNIYVTGHENLVAVEFEIFDHAFGGKPAGLRRKAARHCLEEQFGKDGCRVQLGLAGITGLRYIEIDATGSKKHPILRPKAISPCFFVPSIPSTIKILQSDVMVAVHRVAEVDFAGIADELKRLLSESTKLIAGVNTKELTSKLNDVLSEVKKIAGYVESTTHGLDEAIADIDLKSAAADLHETIKRVRSLVVKFDKNSQRLLEQSHKTMVSVEKLSKKGAEIATRMDERVKAADVPASAKALRTALDKGGRASDKVADLREDARRTLRELNSTLQTIRRFVDYVERNPDAFLSGKREPNPAAR